MSNPTPTEATEPTAEARRAACKVLFASKPYAKLTAIEELAMLIDHETRLPKLLARVAELERLNEDKFRTIQAYCTAASEDKARVAELERERGAALEKITRIEPCLDGAGGVFYPHRDADGNEVGVEQVDPIATIGEMVNIATAALSPTSLPEESR